MATTDAVEAADASGNFFEKGFDGLTGALNSYFDYQNTQEQRKLISAQAAQELARQQAERSSQTGADPSLDSFTSRKVIGSVTSGQLLLGSVLLLAGAVAWKVFR